MKRKDWIYLFFAVMLSLVSIILHETGIDSGRPFLAYLTGIFVGLFIGSNTNWEVRE